MKHDALPRATNSSGPGWARLPVPRVGGRLSTAATLLGLALLLLLAAFGAALVHIVEYHLGLAGDWRRSVAAMLAQRPLSIGMLIVILGALATACALHREVRLLRGRHAALTRQAARAGLHTSQGMRAPRRPRRLLELLAVLVAAQAGMYALADHLWPMGTPMRMAGVWMIMQSHGALPLPPLHLLVAFVLAAAIWLLERRIILLRAAIAVVRRLLPIFLTQMRAALLPIGPATPRLSVQASPALLSRPPPH